MATTPKGIYYPNNYNEIADIPEDMKKMAESIDEVFEDTDSDLSDIKEEQTTQNNRLNSLETDNTTNKSDILTNKQEINNIKTEQTEQNTNISTNATNIESLQEENVNLKSIVAQLPQVTGQGTSITLENTIEAQFTIFDVEGNTRQSNLPAEYTQLDYITSDGNAFIDAGIILGKNYKVDVDFVNNVVRNVEQPIVSIWTTSSNWWNLFINSSGVLDFYAKGHNYLGEVAIGEKQKLNIIRDNNKITVIKNGESFPISVNDTEVNNTTLKLFKRGDNQGDSRISILATSVYDNNILVRNFIPCKNSNNVIGMYDLANGVFYANAGTGTFTAGDASLPTPENPISIKNTGDSGSINEKIQNKNIISSENIDATYMGVKYLSQDNGTILANGKKYGGAYFNLTDTIVTLENETYSSKVFLLNGSISRDGTNIHPTVYLINQADTSKSYNIGEIGNPGKSQLIEAGTYYLRIATWEDNTIFANAEIGIMLVKGSTIPTAYVPHEEQDYSIFVQQPFRSIGDVRDCFVKKDGNWYERHLPYIASYNGETLPQDVYNEVDNVKYCNEKSMSTTGQFSIGASVQYVDENNWNYLPCTEEQIVQLENKPSTYKDFTIINSEDETPAYLEVSGIRDINTMFDKVTNAIVSLGGNV